MTIWLMKVKSEFILECLTSSYVLRKQLNNAFALVLFRSEEATYYLLISILIHPSIVDLYYYCQLYSADAFWNQFQFDMS